MGEATLTHNERDAWRAYPCPPDDGLTKEQVDPVAFGRWLAQVGESETENAYFFIGSSGGLRVLDLDNRLYAWSDGTWACPECRAVATPYNPKDLLNLCDYCRGFET